MKNRIVELEQQIKEMEIAFRQRNLQLDLLRQSGLELSSEHNLDVLLQSIAVRATDIANTEQCVLFLWQPEEGALKVAATTDESLIPVNWEIKPGEGMSGIVWETGKPLIVDDYDHWAQRLSIVSNGLQSVVVVPIRWRDQMLGVLNFVRRENKEPFSKEDVELAELFAAQAAVAIKNTSLLNQVQSYAYDLQMEVIERKRAEEALRQHKDNLEKLVFERTDELERSNRELRRFNYVASHDLQEPLRKIQLLLSRFYSLYEQKLDDKGQDYLSRVLTTTSRMQTLVRDLLTFSRVMQDERKFEWVDLNSIVNGVLTEFGDEITNKNGRVLIEQLPEIEAIPKQMRQLFFNLIGNAIKYCQPETPLVLKISCTENLKKQVEISVSDNGIGIDEKYLDRIFVAFQRLHPKDKYRGTGVGLAICRFIVEFHNGEISSSSQPGQGTQIRIILPITQT